MYEAVLSLFLGPLIAGFEFWILQDVFALSSKLVIEPEHVYRFKGELIICPNVSESEIGARSLSFAI